MSDIGPQKQPATVGQIEAQTKAVRRELEELTMEEFDAVPTISQEAFDQLADDNWEWGE